MLTARLLVYLAMSFFYMISALYTSNLIMKNPWDERVWLLAGPPLALTTMLLAVMINDLLS